MDFMKWLNSLDELLYEVMSWLLFFPITLWRALTQPSMTMASVARQTLLPESQQYAALLSPPLFLTLALLLAHGVAMALGQTDAIVANRHGLAALVNDATTALVLRVLVFASFPLFLAARLIRRSGIPLDRLSLRSPFYEQCYPSGVFALGVSVGTSLTLTHQHWTEVAAIAVLVLTIIYFVTVETLWFAKHGSGGLTRAFGSVVLALVQSALFVLAVGFVFTR